MGEATVRLRLMAFQKKPRVEQAQAEFEALLRDEAGVEIVSASRDADLVVVLGGDGAILRACRKMGAHQRPIVGVNLGRLGFLADYSPAEFRAQLSALKSGSYRVVEHLMFECRLVRADGTSESFHGLNETAISSGASLRMLHVHLDIDGEEVATYSCDGLIVSTPVGSTAHSLSAGGPILRQDMQAFVVTPICPHTLTNRPLVDHADRVYRLRVPQAHDDTLLVVDGQVRRPVGPGDEITIRRSPHTFKLARAAGHSYFQTLHKKLGWAGHPRYEEG
jgi:NAD+ kinase